MYTKKSALFLTASFLVASMFAPSTSSAADFGGDCCADLEERIAELEATTARKGNRKVSLTITGFVAEILTQWDDGVEQNTYQTGAGTTLSSNVQLMGKAQIAPGWNAGYHLHIELNPNDPFHVSQDTPTGIFNPGLPSFSTGVVALQSYWFIDSKEHGKVSLGKVSPFSDNVTILGVDGSGLGSIFAANSPNFGNVRNFAIRRDGAQIPGFTWGSIANCWTIGDAGTGISMDCAAAPGSFVRYDSPVWNGFSVGGSWGEDDVWDVGAKYSGQHGPFQLNIAGAYLENNDENHIVPNSLFAGAVPITERDVSYFQIGAYLQHMPTGLFVYGTYGREEIDSPNAATASPSGFELDSNEAFYLKGGLIKKWFPIGNTVAYVEYQQSNDMLDYFSLQAGATGSKLERFGVGLVQDIDAAGMSLWAAYKHFDGEIDGPAATCTTLCGDLDEFERIEIGGVILF